MFAVKKLGKGYDVVINTNEVVASTLNITFSNGAVPNGTYDVQFYNATIGEEAHIETRSIEFTDSTLSEEFSITVGTEISGNVRGDNMPTNGAPFYGVTE